MDNVELHVSPVLDTWLAPHSPRLQVSGFTFPGHIQVMSSQSCSDPPSDHINTAQLQIISAKLYFEYCRKCRKILDRWIFEQTILPGTKLYLGVRKNNF